MNFGVKVTFLIGLVSVNCIDLTDWKPIIGTSSNLNAITQRIVVDPSLIGASSSSKSTITFNGQTITTSIGDVTNTNDAIGSVLTVDPSSDLNGGVIDTEGRYLGYSGKVLSGFLSASQAVSSFNWQSSVWTAFDPIGYQLSSCQQSTESTTGKKIFNYRKKMIDKSSIQFSIQIFASWLFYCPLFANTLISANHPAQIPISNHIVNQLKSVELL